MRWLAVEVESFLFEYADQALEVNRPDRGRGRYTMLVRRPKNLVEGAEVFTRG